MLEPACLMGAWYLGLCAFICPVLDSKQDSLQFSAVLLQMFCDTYPVLGTFFKGIVVQKAQELHFLWWFSGTAQCLTTCSFLSCSILISLSSLGPSCYLTLPSLLLCMSEMYLSPCFHCNFLLSFCPCCSVGHAGQHVCAWSSVDVSIRRPGQPTLVLLALMSPSHGTVTSGQEWHSVPQTPIPLYTAWLFKLSLGVFF